MFSYFPKVLAVALTVMVFFKTYYDFKKKQDSIFTLVFWSITWFLVSIFSLWPELLFKIRDDLAIERFGIGTFFGTAFIFLLFIVYRVYIKAHRIELKMRQIVKEIGIKNVDKQ